MMMLFNVLIIIIFIIILSNFVFHDDNNANNVYNDYWMDYNYMKNRLKKYFDKFKFQSEIFRFIKILLNYNI